MPMTIYIPWKGGINMIGLLISEENEHIELVLYSALGRVILTEYGVFASHEDAIRLVESSLQGLKIASRSYQVDVEEVLKAGLKVINY